MDRRQHMAIHNTFPIKRIEGYHTQHLGKFADGKQFFGTIAETFIQPRNYQGNWQEQVQQHLLLYIFVRVGNHIHTRHQQFEGNARNSFEIQVLQLDKMIEEMGAFEYGDIRIKPFPLEMEVSGVKMTFGLVPLHEQNVVVLEPGYTIALRAPWDGSYDT